MSLLSPRVVAKLLRPLHWHRLLFDREKVAEATFSKEVLMASRDLERIHDAILDGRYTLTEHAYDEMEEDHLDALDVESAVLTGVIDKMLTVDPCGTRFVVIGSATD